jgi:two-component system cell cycle response regulator
MDIQLPGMDGLSATRIIKEDAALKDIPIIAITSYAMQGDENKAIEAGCIGYLSKPIETRTFLDTVNSFFNNAKTPIKSQKDKEAYYTARILIVDDDPLNVKLLASKLDGRKYEILQAYGGIEALEKVEKKSPDLILLDVMMPDMDGYEVTTRLKNDPKTANIPIIMVTALDGSEDKIQGLEAGAEEFLSKPVNTTELLARINSMLRLRRYREQLAIRTQSGEYFAVTEDHKGALQARENLPCVLLVEDDEQDIKLLLNYLHGQPYHIMLAKNGEDAISLAAQKKIDLVLLDILLPGMDGFETCNRLKEMDKTSNIQIVLITNLSDLESKIKGVEMGSDDFLVKPINSKELLVRINALLKKKEYMDKLHSHYENALDSAIKDGLTELYNHAYFNRFLELEVKRSIRQGYSTALIMMDLDDFKQYNDKLGHLAGDRILRESAQVIKDSVREIDLAARYGGEEFVVILPYADSENALNVAERIQKAISNYTFSYETVSALKKITFSIGIATCPSDSLTAEELIQNADSMLYKAKKEGKNRVYVYDKSLEQKN